jgi:ariadne-1
LIPVIENKINYLIKVKLLSLLELDFLNEALNTVISSKTTLKYSYVFGFYIDPKSSQKNLFEFSQSFLEKNANKLHQLLEETSINEIISEENFELSNNLLIDFKNKIVNLNYATAKYRKNLLDDIENTMMIISYCILNKII